MPFRRARAAQAVIISSALTSTASLAGRRAGGALASTAHGHAGGAPDCGAGGWVLGAGTPQRPGARDVAFGPAPAARSWPEGVPSCLFFPARLGADQPGRVGSAE